MLVESRWWDGYDDGGLNPGTIGLEKSKLFRKSKSKPLYSQSKVNWSKSKPILPF